MAAFSRVSRASAAVAAAASELYLPELAYPAADFNRYGSRSCKERERQTAASVKMWDVLVGRQQCHPRKRETKKKKKETSCEVESVLDDKNCCFGVVAVGHKRSEQATA